MSSLKSPRVGVAGILVRPDGRILLGRRAHQPGQGRWAFPGGKVEFQELLEDALVREFLEETGLAVEVGPLAHLAEIIDARFGVHYVVLDFIVTASHWNGAPASDIDALAWVGQDDWNDYPLSSGMDTCLQDPAVQRLMGWLPS